MSNETPKDDPCDRCGGTMEYGVLVDGHHEHHQPGRWVAGPAEVGLAGLKEYHKRRKYIVSAYRCTSCGWLDFYARLRG